MSVALCNTREAIGGLYEQYVDKPCEEQGEEQDEKEGDDKSVFHWIDHT